jgi:FkbM family methyltransferase
MSMTHPFYRFYNILFGRKVFYPFNRFLFKLSLRGLGIYNYESQRASGEKTFIEKTAKKLEVAFDVGGNVGDYAKTIKQFNKECHVYSFEPHPVAYARLAETAKEYVFQAFNFGFGKENGTSNLYDHANSSFSSHASVYPDAIEKIHKDRHVKYEIEIRTVDDFVKQHGIENIDLLKIDTEGCEYDILLGASNVLAARRVKLVHFEFNEMNVLSRVFFRDFLRLLQEFYLFRMLRGGLIRLHEYRPIENELFAYQNILAVHKPCLTDFLY